MASNPRSQQEVATFFKNKEKKLQDKRLFESESETIEFLNWAELPVTKKVRQTFGEVKKKFHDYFESQKWSNEAEARGLAYSLRFLDTLEKLVESYKKVYENIQTKKQKEG